MKTLILAILLLAGCASNLAEDPAVRDLQRWTATCAVYKAVLDELNTRLEAGTIDKTSSIVTSFKKVKLSLQPVCENPEPPKGLDVATFRTMLDGQFIELMRLQGELT